MLCIIHNVMYLDIIYILYYYKKEEEEEEEEEDNNTRMLIPQTPIQLIPTVHIYKTHLCTYGRESDQDRRVHNLTYQPDP